MKAISTAAEADKDLPPGLYSVTKAAGLYLQVSEAKTKSWVLALPARPGAPPDGPSGAIRS